MRRFVLAETKQELLTLREQMDLAEDVLGELFCPDCGGALVERSFGTELVSYRGQEMDIDHEVLSYECGRTIIDDELTDICRTLREPPPGE